MADTPAPVVAPARLDLRRTHQALGSVVSGFGLTPSAARERAAVVRAVTHEPGIRQRPMPVVIIAGLIALVGLGVWAWQLYLTITEETPLTPLFWAGLGTFLAASAVCSWAWQLYDVQKAIVMWLALAVLGVAAVLIIVFVLVALKGDSDDLDIDLGGLIDRITGPGIEESVTLAEEVVLPLMVGASDGVGQGISGPVMGSLEAPAHAPARPVAGPLCRTCERPVTAGLLICPACGTPTG